MNIIELDPLTKALYFYVPRHNIVYLQGVIELFEGLATLRTIDIKRSLMCLITTNEQIDLVIEMMNSNKGEIKWHEASLEDIKKDDFIDSYGRKTVKIKK